MTTEELARRLEAVRGYRMSPEEREAQRRSFAYGNTHLANPAITREMVDRAAAAIAAIEAAVR